MTARKKSERRQREKQVKLRCTAGEFNAIAAKASASGMSAAAYARASMLGDAGPRAQRRLPVDARNIRQVLALHGRYGNNLNQIAYMLNVGEASSPLLPEIRSALKEWGEARDAMLHLLGKDAQPPA